MNKFCKYKYVEDDHGIDIEECDWHNNNADWEPGCEPYCPEGWKRTHTMKDSWKTDECDVVSKQLHKKVWFIYFGLIHDDKSIFI